jgi:ADP-heptose:LPS heptosyltransferase
VRIFVLKPDNIGDFVLACGAIRLLADQAGEENLVLAVKADVAPLARQEFPRARILALPIRPRRRGERTTLVNFLRCLPVLVRLRGLRADVAVCLRDKRTTLQTLLFLAPRATRRVACENSLPRVRQFRWSLWERMVHRMGRPVLLPYPPAEPGAPSDLIAHRVVAAEALGRSVTLAEVMPRLRCAHWSGGDHWLLCPLSSKARKDFPAERWAEALRETRDLLPPGGIRLVGSPDQAARLMEFAAALRNAGVEGALQVDHPAALADFPASLARSALVLTVDTAAAHVACAAGTPAVIVATLAPEYQATTA